MLEAALNKSGPELFKELLRVYPVADLDDYWRGGLWKNDLMKTDLVLIESHRREAGAPDPIPLEEVQMPELPIQCKLPGMFGMVAVNGVVPPKAAAMAGATTAAGGPVAELRLIALFVAKWKMDPTKTKLLLAKMTPARRRYVIQNFKTSSSGTEASIALDHFIAGCEKSGDWDKAPTVVAPKPLVPGAVAPPKRPSITPTVIDPSKKPRIAGTVAPPSGAPAAWAAKMAALRGQAPTTVPQIGKVISPIRPIAPKIVPKVAPKAGIWS
mmetsp:Transcript_151060/g.263242  ORF Transcript_151060/g.263242 Transcript_151060/m.263242 type:complete len:269 (-) Transcript_151060:207-1013(-)